MEKSQKSVLMLSMITACLMLVAFVGVGYAAFTVGINVTGTGKVASSKWEVKFGTPTFNSSSSTATQITPPTVNENSTEISDFVVQLVTPGDSVSYTFDVINNGTFDAKLSTFTKAATPTCTGMGANATTDAANVCKYLTYTLKYSNGQDVKVNDELKAGAANKKTVVLTLTYGSGITAAELPVQDVTISGLNIIMNYSQVQTS